MSQVVYRERAAARRRTVPANHTFQPVGVLTVAEPPATVPAPVAELPAELPEAPEPGYEVDVAVEYPVPTLAMPTGEEPNDGGDLSMLTQFQQPADEADPLDDEEHS